MMLKEVAATGKEAEYLELRKAPQGWFRDARTQSFPTCAN